MYGYFAAAFQFIPGVGMLLVIPLLQKKFKVSDTTLMLCGICTSAGSEFYLSFCKTTWMVWLGKKLSAFEGRRQRVGRMRVGKRIRMSDIRPLQVIESFKYENIYNISIC